MYSIIINKKNEMPTQLKFYSHFFIYSIRQLITNRVEQKLFKQNDRTVQYESKPEQYLNFTV